MDKRDVVEELVRFWSVQDVESSVALMRDDCVWVLNISETALPFGGETCGKDKIAEGFYAILADWDYISYVPTILAIKDGKARLQVQHVYRFRRTGEDLAGSFRINIEVVDGLVSRIEEYHDAAMVETFMRLAQSGRSNGGQQQWLPPRPR